MAREYLDDIKKSQKGRPHPDKQVPFRFLKISNTCCIDVRTFQCLRYVFSTSCVLQFRNNPKYRIYKVYEHTKSKSGPVLFWTDFVTQSLSWETSMPGGTEKTASTKMTKTLGVETAIEDGLDDMDAASSSTPPKGKGNGKGAKSDPKSEGTSKAIESMFTAMAPLKSKKRDKSDSDDDGNPKRRRANRGNPNQENTSEVGIVSKFTCKPFNTCCFPYTLSL